MFSETKRLQLKKSSKFTHPYHSTHYGSTFPPSGHFNSCTMYNNHSLPCVGTCTRNENKAVCSHLRSYQWPAVFPLMESAPFSWNTQGSLPSLLPHPPLLLCSLLGKMNVYPANTHLVQLASGEHHFLGYSSKIKQTQNEFTDYTIHL